MMPITQTVITDQDAEKLIHDLVAIPSFSYQEADAVNFLVDWMTAQGYDRAFVDEAGNAVGIIGHGNRTLMMLGHIDTFMGNPPVRLDGRHLYGRGAVDAKGALCAFAVAGRLAVIPDDWRIVVVGAVEEECPTSAGARHIMTQYAPDMCIIGEPSRWDRMTLGYKGRLILEWAWRGALGHSAGQMTTPAEHAFADFGRIHEAVTRINADKTGVFDVLDMTLQAVNTGHDDSGHGWATMTVGFRLPIGLSPEDVMMLCREAINSDASITFTGMEHAFLSEKDNPLTRVMRGAIRAHGGKPAFVVKTGTSDMNIVGREWQCPIIAYGAGDSSLDHTPHEHLDLDEFILSIRVLTSAIEQIS
ncbi:MAG: [LysW]-lysine hydrolase [Anaerolineae bacterium]|nr:[LysW]-lysine hydrolase [Anaerolineae bacterium]